ncbi:hypothetical protein [Amedibacterium intestinale]|uniref:hypothetical protein n=1 Tax=Amedibacterium intestinale TaxID=2583452 RepID=UPI000E51FF9D|nr:hypothetical protein [Amedibacterium intestinale]RHO23809.1 hypothetical protein DW220_02030 [Eubacterium sp. AM18-26]RHO27903.1 hypothetical protein DW212_02565 [Eubacterium sp. AM18-10LB-B]
MKELVCPHCENDKEFYTKESYKGKCKVYFRSDGKETENGSMYEYAEHKLISKFVFCAECDRRVCKVEEIKVN